MVLHLYNTASRQKQSFSPADPARVTMYVCGPTVYDFAHIGNARPVVVFDTLYRLLQHFYPTVLYARNITDIDDKIITAASTSGEPITAITERYTAAYNADMQALNALPPPLQPKATDHIAAMQTIIEQLLADNHAYVADGHVLFDTASMASYGALSGRSLDDMIAGARVEVAPYKKNPADFVLWKPSTPDQPHWDSPWGIGRPGWHIECSAMIAAHLGTSIDIHGGGHDLIFPHHENERAQSECAHNHPFVRHWMHNGFVTVDGHKMSKSLGNFTTVRQLRDQGISGEAIRWVLLSAHYRQPVDWSLSVAEQTTANLDKCYGALRRVTDIAVEPSIDPQLLAALCDDLNTPQTFVRLHELVANLHRAETHSDQYHAKAALLGSAALLGLLQQHPDAWFQGSDTLDVAYIEEQIQQRTTARQQRNFALSDQIRDDLLQKGIMLEDGAHGTTWKKHV